MYRKKRRTRSGRIGSNVVGFYTRDHKVRPITPPRRHRTPPTRWVLAEIASATRTDLEKPLLEKAADHMLRQAPIAGEIRAAYSLADALYSNWGTVMHLYKAYERGGAQAVANTIATDTVHDGLSKLQTDTVWAAISRFIPQQYHHAENRYF